MSSLIDQLRQHSPFNSYERAMCARLQSFLETSGERNPFGRDLAGTPPEQGHVTGSAWIVNQDFSRVVLLHHRKLGKWVQPGGHCDGEREVLSVAQRETWEETGLQSTPLLDGRVFDVDIHVIPAYWNTPEHLHFDVRYLLQADDSQRIICSHESKAVRWVSLEEALQLSGEESVARMVEKTLQLRDNPKNHLR